LWEPYSNSAVVLWVSTVPPFRPFTLNRTAMCPRTATFPSVVTRTHEESNTHKVSVRRCCDARSHFKCISDQHQNNILWEKDNRVSSWRNSYAVPSSYIFFKIKPKTPLKTKEASLSQSSQSSPFPWIFLSPFPVLVSVCNLFSWRSTTGICSPSHRQDFIRTSWH